MGERLKVIDYRICVSAALPVFMQKIKDCTDKLQQQGLTVEVQYKPVLDADGGLVYTALLLGRRAI